MTNEYKPRAYQVDAIAEARLLARGGRVVWDCTPDPMAELLGESAPTIRSVVRRRDGSVSVTTFAVDAGRTTDTKIDVKAPTPTPEQVTALMALKSYLTPGAG